MWSKGGSRKLVRSLSLEGGWDCIRGIHVCRYVEPPLKRENYIVKYRTMPIFCREVDIQSKIMLFCNNGLILTLWRKDGPVRFNIGKATARLTTARSTRQHFVHPAVFSLQIFDFHYVLQTVDGASEINLPDGRVGFVAILARMDGPFTKQRSVALLAVVALFGVDPWDSENGLLAVDPLQAMKPPRVNHATDPVPHSLWLLTPLSPLLLFLLFQSLCFCRLLERYEKQV